MASTMLAILAAVCLAATSTMAQFSPLMFALGGEDFFEGGGSSYFLYSSLEQRINQLELGVRTGAIGGCESGVVGPFTPTQRVGTIQFRGQFLAPPSVSLAISDLVELNPALPVNVQIRPSSVTRESATITVTDATNSIASAYVSYMVCPSNSAMNGQNGFQG